MPLHIASQKQGVVWHGSFFVHHSLALVNRELTLGLLDNPAFTGKFSLSLEEYEPAGFDPDSNARYSRLTERCNTALNDVRVTVRHRWPPDFTPTATGKLALIQPWEFGSLPRDWVPAIDKSVDEIWVPSHYVRNSYLLSGVPGDKVFVVPNGVNTQQFHPEVTPFDFARLPENQRPQPDDYKFLFVGGTIARKGVDALLDAYDRTFRASDNVVLIIKDFGQNSFYANQGAGALIRALQAKPGGARILYLTEDMTESEIAGLYAACDCLVHPYRGEGYGLPIAEAMACGKPTIVTNYGAALDFANSDNSYLVPATVQKLPEKRIGDMETVDYPTLAEPDRMALSSILRRVSSNREAAAAIGAQAARDIAAKHTWAHAAEIAAERLIALAESEKTRTSERSFLLPMGLGNVGLGGKAASDTVSGNAYEQRKQAALAHTRKGDWPQAVTELQACLLEDERDWDVQNALAVALFRTGKTDEAIALLQKGIGSASNPRDFHHNLAFIQLEVGRPLEALDDALAALAISPDNTSLRRTLERVRDGILQKARKILRSYPDQQRVQAKRDPEYRALMEQYHLAEESLKGHAAANPQPAGSTPQASKMADTPKLSLCMIVKNEERFLRSCLESAKDVVDEIVIVDTGSTDGTLAIAQEYGATIVRHEWNDDFAEARNVSLEHATGNWALWLDADEEIAPETKYLFRPAMENAAADIGGYMIMFRNWLSSTTRDQKSEMAIHHACRLFRRIPGVRFEGRIHEQNLRSLQAMGYTYAKGDDMIIDHFGYAGEIMTLRNKHERFIRMLTREVEECLDENFRTFHLFNLGNAHFTFGNMEQAARYLGEAADSADPTEEYTVTLYVEWATALHRLNRPQEGLEVCERADRQNIRQAGIDFARGYCLLHLKRYEESEEAFRTALKQGETKEGLYALTGDVGAAGFKSRYGLALALVGQDRYEEGTEVCTQTLAEQPTMVEARYLKSICLARTDRTAEACDELEIILQQKPDHDLAEHDLAVLLMEAKDYARALPYVRHQAEISPNSYDAQASYATCCECLGLIEEARNVYERLRFLAPDSAEICVNLGRVLAASGDDATAIDMFADAIQINPGYGNAYFNAGDVLYRLGYYARAAETYTAGLEVEPEHPAGFFVLGNCYFQTRDYQAAVLSYQEALRQNPGHAEARNNLSMALDMLKMAA